MNDFFNLDAPLFRFLTRVADMVILSLLWLIGSLPLFTLGISSTALYYAVNKSLIEDRGTVSEEFFRAYRRSFRQATLSFLALAVPESILLADCFMTHYLKGQQVVLAAFGLLTAFCPPLILLAPAGYALFARWVLEKKVFYQYLPDIDDGIDKENKDCSHQD